MVGRLYHLGRARSRARARELLSSFGFSDAGDRLVGTYSGGMRRRLDLAAALLARPPVLFLDEPTTGLDIRSRIDLWDAIEALVSEGTTVLLDHSGPRRGRPARRSHRRDRSGPGDRGRDSGGAEDPDRRRAARHPPLRRRARRGGPRRSVLDRKRPPVSRGRVGARPRRPAARDDRRRGPPRRLDDAGIAIDDISVSTPTLDDVFLNLTGRPTSRRPRRRRCKPGDGACLRDLRPPPRFWRSGSLLRIPRQPDLLVGFTVQPIPLHPAVRPTSWAGRSRPRASTKRRLPDARDHRPVDRLRRLRDGARARGRPQEGAH